MANYAFVDENNIVVDIITGRDENDLPNGISSWEEHYGEIHGLRCLRYSANTHGNVHVHGKDPFRYNPAIVGGVYDEQRDAFIAPQPAPECSGPPWVLNQDTLCWEEQVPKPNDGYGYRWDSVVDIWFRVGPSEPVPDTTKNWAYEPENNGWVEIPSWENAV